MPDKLIPGKKKTMAYQKSSGFKMKGSPMQRNFGIGSPMKDDFMTKARAAAGTAADIFKSNEPITAIGDIKKTFKTNLEYQKYLKKQKEKKEEERKKKVK